MTSPRFKGLGLKGLGFKWVGLSGAGWDTSVATWRGRAIRYVLIYLSLVVALVGLRYMTQDIRPDLRAALEREAALVTRRDDLAVQVQSLENPQRIRDWAFANGMRRFAEAPKETQTIPGNPRAIQAAELQANRTVKVITQWK